MPVSPLGAIPVAHIDPLESLECRRLLADSSIRFAVIGDFGNDAAGTGPADVARLVKSWQPDLVITAGDNNYPIGEASTIDRNIGKHYQELIADYKGSYGAGAIDGVNRFFPSLGNHDWFASEGEPPLPAPYLNYFTLPGNQRYYDFVRGPVHFFALDSDALEPDGIAADSAQAAWLKRELAGSTSPWNVVYFHHSPYSSALHGSDEMLQWPFQQWGADVVITGHDHVYERIIDPASGFPYLINGLGGNSIYHFLEPVPGSRVRYNADFGAMKVDATASRMTLQFITRSGRLVDTYTLSSSPTPPAAPSGLWATALSSRQVNLAWEDRADDEGAYLIERATRAAGSFDPIAELVPGATHYNDRTALPSTEYRYRVRAVNSAGASAASNIADVTTPATGGVQLVTGDDLAAVATSQVRVDLSWDDISGETGYTIERSLDGITYAHIADLPAQTVEHAVSGLAPGTLYYFRLRGYRSDGESPFLTTTIVTRSKGPSADIIDVSPDPRTTPVTSVQIKFDRAVSGFDLSALRLARSGGANLIRAGQALATTDGGVTWTLSGLDALTAAPGRYTLILHKGQIVDAEQDALVAAVSEAWEMRTQLPPPPPPPAPALEGQSDTGVRDDDHVTADSTPTFAGAAPAGAVITLYANGNEIGTAAVEGGAYRVTAPLLAPGLYAITVRVTDVLGDQSVHSESMTLSLDLTPPRVERLRFNGSSPASAHVRSISLAFSEGVTVRRQDLVIRNLATGQDLDSANSSMTYDSSSRTATWVFGGRMPPDGNYRLTFAATVSDAAGNPFDGNSDGSWGDAYAAGFFQLAGDANLDRVVDHQDFLVLRENFGRSATPEQGDFTGDGKADFRDFQLLEPRFGRTLAEPDPEAGPAAVTAPKRVPPPPPTARRLPTRTFSAKRLR